MRDGRSFDGSRISCSLHMINAVRASSALHTQLEVKSSHAAEASMNDAKASFGRAVTLIRWVLTNGLRLFFQFWYAREPIFWIPKGWVPNFVEWILAFPKAPRGSVSVQIWGIACASVIHMASEAIVAAYMLMSRTVSGKEQKGQQAHAMAGQGISMPERSQAKKEL